MANNGPQNRWGALPEGLTGFCAVVIDDEVCGWKSTKVHEDICGAHVQQRGDGKPFRKHRKLREAEIAARTEKPCCVCRVVLSAEHFYVGKTGSLSGNCKACSRASASAWNKANPDRVRQSAQRHANKRGEARRADPETYAKYRAKLLERYNLTQGRYDEMLSSQGGVCAICKSLRDNRPLHIDHDHACCPGSRSCGQCVRGLLCVVCNTTLGYMENHEASINAYLEVSK